MANSKPTPPHGTSSRYTNQGCRCDECRAAQAAYAKAYRLANKDKERAYQDRTRDQRSARRRERYAADPSARRSANRAWASANPNSGRARTKRYAQRHPGRVKSSTQTWRMANADRIRLVSSSWVDRNRTKTVIYSAKRRALMLAADCRSVTNDDWRRLVARFNSRCAYCGSAGQMTQDHVVPLVRGGRHSIGNLLPACKSCNSSKGSKLLAEWRLPTRLDK